MKDKRIMDELIKQFLKKQYTGTEIAFGYILSGSVYFKGWVKEGEEIKEKENSDRLFEIGSITKVFTSTVLAQILNEEKINDEALISSIISIDELKKTKISLKSLANHTSGLPRLPENFYTIQKHDDRNPYLNYNEEALISYFENNLISSNKRNTDFEYSNLGFGILGYVISKIEKSPFDSVVHKRILKPLKMNSTSFELNTKSNSVVGLNEKGIPSNHWEGGILNGCIGITSSAKDMAKFIKYMLEENNKDSKLQLTETHKIEEDHSIGLGWGIRKLADGSKSYNHGGGSDGYSCYLKLHKATQSGIILLTNISAFRKNHQKELNELASNLRDEIRSRK